MRKLPVLLAALIAIAILAPAQAQAFKPEIVNVRATFESQGVRFTAKVRMDQGGVKQRRVSVTYDGERKRARALDKPPLSLYETRPFSAPSRDCYRVTVRARNRFGTTVRTMRADTFGTDGCG